MEATLMARRDGKVGKAQLVPLLESIREDHLHSSGADAVKCAAACNWLARIEVDVSDGDASVVRPDSSESSV